MEEPPDEEVRETVFDSVFDARKLKGFDNKRVGLAGGTKGGMEGGGGWVKGLWFAETGGGERVGEERERFREGLGAGSEVEKV